MKSCDGCAECCYAMQIDEINKPENTWCKEVKVSAAGSCSCGVHDRKPSSCASFFCLWLMSQMRPEERERLPDELRPDRSHVVFYRNRTESDLRFITAHVNSQFPSAWHSDAVSNEIARLINRGAIICVVAGDKRVFFQKGQPTVTTDAKTAAKMAGKTIVWERPVLPVGARAPHW